MNRRNIIILLTVLCLLATLAFSIAPKRGAEYLGAGKGTTFRVYAPHASTVSVAGDWNSWSATANPLAKGDFDVWYGTIPQAERYMKYKYVVDGTLWNKDPNSFMVEHSGWDGNSIIADFGHYQWSTNESNWQSGGHVPSITQMVIYQMHLKSFMYKNDGVPYQYGKMFETCIRYKLDYLKDLGINAILLMPITEFPGDQSWGYNTAFWFAVEAAYGSVYEFQHFVDQCHQRGIAVLVDLCYNHAGPNDINHYWNFDGGYVNTIGGNGNYFYTDWRGKTPWGDTEPNWGKWDVRDMFIENGRMWIQDFHCDGMRLDSTGTIRKDKDDGYDWDGSDDANGWSFLQYYNNEIRPLKGGKVATIAEDIAGNSWITKNTGEGGAGFVAQWQPSPIVNVVTQWDDNNRDMNEVARAIGQTIGTNYGYHEIVKYHSSHDTLDARNNHWRLPNKIGDPFQWYAWKRTKLAQGIILCSPGTPMIFMGDEFYSKGQWDDDPDHALDWSELAWNRNFWEYTRALIRLKTARHHGAMLTNNLEIPVIDHSMKIISWKRWDNSGSVLIFVANFRGSEQTRGIPFPSDGTWYEILNSDAAGFGGDNVGNGGSVNVSGSWANVHIGSYSLIVFAQKQDAYPPSWAQEPNPADGAINVDRAPNLSWRWASDAASYNVFFGADKAAVENAGQASPEFKGNQTGTEFKPGNLDAFKIYYWRIDSVNNAGVTKGAVWRFNTGDGNSGGLGRALWTPKKPAAGGSVTIYYYAEDGPLSGAGTMFLHWGINNWKNVVDNPMTAQSANIWSIAINLPATASYLDFVFTTNPTGGAWDNNSGADWHVPVQESSPRVEWSPETPIQGVPMTILYHAAQGPLAGSPNIYIHRGFNKWTNVIHVPMVKASGEDWTHTFTPPSGTTRVDFVFASGAEGAPGTQWDNNNSLDWYVDVISGDIPIWGISNTHLQPIAYQGTDAPDWGVQVWNNGKGTLNWKAVKQDAGYGTGWFSIAPIEGSSAGVAQKTNIAVTFDTDKLASGIYKARIVLSDKGGILTDAPTSITLTMQRLNHLIVHPASLDMDWPATGTTETTFTLRNDIRGGTMPYELRVVEPEAAWLTLSPTSGTVYEQPNSITVMADTAGLEKKDYTAQIEVKASFADNSPALLPVRLRGAAIPTAWELY